MQLLVFTRVFWIYIKPIIDYPASLAHAWDISAVIRPTLVGYAWKSITKWQRLINFNCALHVCRIINSNLEYRSKFRKSLFKVSISSSVSICNVAKGFRVRTQSGCTRQNCEIMSIENLLSFHIFERNLKNFVVIMWQFFVIWKHLFFFGCHFSETKVVLTYFITCAIYFKIL